MTDARLLNWQLVVPDDDEPVLVLPANGEAAAALEDGLRTGPYRGVVATDLSALRAAGPGGAAGALARLASIPPAGGWLYAGFSNPLYGGTGRGGLSLRRAIHILREAGLDAVAYAALPSHRRPAWLVPVRRRAELDLFFRRMVFPYAPVASPVAARLAAWVVRAGRVVALGAPHRLRVRLAPAYAVVARRPA